MIVQDVFDQAMGIMDELSGTGEAITTDTEEYAYRTPAIINMMVSELRMMTGETDDWLPVTGMDDFIPTADTTYALGAMGYGLAANLLIDENPTAASFYEQRYEEMRTRYVMSRVAESEEIENVYGSKYDGGIEYGWFGRW